LDKTCLKIAWHYPISRKVFYHLRECNHFCEASGTKDPQAVKPSKDFEEVLAGINAGLRDLHYRVLELEQSSREKGKHER